jgi:hypothetical protein
VQIGLLPNTDWLKGTSKLSPRGEIDHRCARPDLAARRVRRRRLRPPCPTSRSSSPWAKAPRPALSAFAHLKLATIKEVEGQPKAMDMVRHLVAAQEATARTARKLFPLVDKANDQPTADLLTQRIEVHEKTAWMLRSLLEDV